MRITSLSRIAALAALFVTLMGAAMFPGEAQAYRVYYQGGHYYHRGYYHGGVYVRPGPYYYSPYYPPPAYYYPPPPPPVIVPPPFPFGLNIIIPFGR